MTIVIANRDHACEILGIQRKFTSDMLRKAYLRQALKYHPDKPGGNKEKFQEIRQAFDYLNDTDGDVTTVFFSLTGATLPASEEDMVFATLVYELTSELNEGDEIALNFVDVVCASSSGTSLISEGVNGSISTGEDSMPGDVNGDGSINVQDIVLVIGLILDGGDSDAADVNGDGLLNVQDIVLIVNMILDTSGRSHDADRAELLKTSSDLLLKADGFVGAVQMTLSHNGNFSIELTDDAMAADYRTTNNQTTLVVVVPGSEQLFTFNGEFERVRLNS